MLSIKTLSLASLVALVAFASTVDADPVERTIRRTLHKGRPATVVKIRNTFVRTRGVAIAAAPNPVVATAELRFVRGDPVVRITPVGAPRGRRVGHTTVTVGGQKWNFNAKRWQRFTLRIRVTVHDPGNAPRRQPVAIDEFQRRTRVAPGRARVGTIQRMVNARAVRKVAMMTGSPSIRARLDNGVLRVTGVKPGRATVMIGGERLDPRTRQWKRFRVRLAVEVQRP